MAKIVKRRRGTTAEHSVFTGAEGELTIDLEKDTVVVHDNLTAGGFALAREDLSNVNLENKIGVQELNLPAGTAGQFLQTDGAPGNLSFATIDVSTSAVGGDVTGTVSNIQLGPSVVGTTELADAAVSESKVLDDAITAPKIADNSVGVGKINVTDGTAGQVLTTTGAGTLVFADSINEIIITPTVGQTQFSGLDYVIGRMAVYLNGVKLLNGTDFTANDGTTMTLTAGASATDKIELQIFA